MTSCEDKKRGRSANFSSDEKTLLLSIVLNKKHIIENKKTDATTWKIKERIWHEVAKEFNAQSSVGIHRTVESLKKFYNNQKKECRKTIANERMQRIATGGGTYEGKEDPTLQLTLALVNEKTVNGLQNTFDGDGSLASNALENEIEIVEITAENEAAITILPINDVNTDWGDHNATNLREPVHPKLKVDKEKQAGWTHCRRPNSTIALNSSQLAKSYTELADIKLQLAKMQKAAIQEEMSIKRDLAEKQKQEIDLRIEGLRLENEIKKAQLRLLNENI